MRRVNSQPQWKKLWRVCLIQTLSLRSLPTKERTTTTRSLTLRSFQSKDRALKWLCQELSSRNKNLGSSNLPPLRETSNWSPNSPGAKSRHLKSATDWISCFKSAAAKPRVVQWRQRQEEVWQSFNSFKGNSQALIPECRRWKKVVHRRNHRRWSQDPNHATGSLKSSQSTITIAKQFPRA